jgi:hypothetical protein
MVNKTAFIQSSEIGAVLEVFYEEWLFIRAATAVYHRDIVRSITLEKLLGIGRVASGRLLPRNPDLHKLLRKEVAVPSELPHRVCLQRSSRDGFDGLKDEGPNEFARKEFLRELEEVDVDSTIPFAIIRPRPRESFDVCLKVLLPDGAPFYVFVDCKSATESTELKLADANVFNKILTEPLQYEYISALAKEGNLRFIYLYQTTYREKSAIAKSGNEGIVLGRDDTMAFFGPVAELYCALCDSVRIVRDDREKEEEEEEEEKGQEKKKSNKNKGGKFNYKKRKNKRRK